MLNWFLIVGLLALLPVAYGWGRRAGFERHSCQWVPAQADVAPARFVTVPCRTCGQPIPCALHVGQGVRDGRNSVTATVDTTDLEHHTLIHAEDVRGGPRPGLGRSRLV